MLIMVVTYLKYENIFEIFSSNNEILTERLLLRKMSRKDAFDMYEYSRNPEVTKYLTWDIHPSLEFTRNYLKYIEKQYKERKFYDWALVLRDNNKMIGTVGYTRFDIPSSSAEVGYVLNPDYWGMGLAAEALKAVIKFSFENLSLNRVEARYMSDNYSSRRVMEKCGMIYEGMARESMFVKNKYISVGTYSILRKEYFR